MIFKTHHSLGDGASLISLINSTSDTFDLDALFPIKNISFWQKLILRLSVPLNLASIFVSFLTTRLKKNPIHDGERNLSGKRIISTGKWYDFNDVKDCAKTYNITINDLITSCLSAGIQQYFKS